jgi:hypothetical protein
MANHRLIARAAASVGILVWLGASGGAWTGAPARTTLTFSGPVALPGAVLGAGTYTFERASVNTPDVVRVLSGDGRHVYFMSFTRTVSRPNGLAEDRWVTFGEAARGVPPRIVAWYPQDSSTGHEFIY